MNASVDERAAALPTFVEISAAFVHLAQFLAHETDDLHAEQRLGAQKFLQCGGLDKAQLALSLAVSAEIVRLRAKHGRQADHAARTEYAVEDLFAGVGQSHRESHKAASNDVDAAARRSLLDDRFLRFSAGRGGKWLQRLQQLRGKLERTATS